jgi:hypothetical protein
MITTQLKHQPEASRLKYYKDENPKNAEFGAWLVKMPNIIGEKIILSLRIVLLPIFLKSTFSEHLFRCLQNTNLLQSILNTIKVPKRDIFVAELFMNPSALLTPLSSRVCNLELAQTSYPS